MYYDLVLLIQNIIAQTMGEAFLNDKLLNELPILVLFIIFMIYILKFHREEREKRDQEWREWFSLVTEDFKTFNEKTRRDFVDALNTHDNRVDQNLDKIWEEIKALGRFKNGP